MQIVEFDFTSALYTTDKFDLHLSIRHRLYSILAECKPLFNYYSIITSKFQLNMYPLV